MKRVLIMPVLAALFAACEGGGSTGPDTTASVRFFNATTGMAGNGGFVANGKFAGGSSLAFGQSTSTCSKVDAGSASFAFGAANSGGTGLTGNALATLAGQNITTGGNYTLVAAGSAAGPTLFLLDNNFSGSVGATQAAVRFVNLSPGAPNLFTVFTGVIGAGGTLTASSIEAGMPTTFNIVTSGSNSFTILNGHDIVISGSDATINLQERSVNTIAIVPGATSGTFRLINVPRCS